MNSAIYEFSVVETCLMCSNIDRPCIKLASEQELRAIIKQHFWYQDHEFENKCICTDCWQKVTAFHKFYIDVEANYKKEETFVQEAGKIIEEKEIEIQAPRKSKGEIEIEDELIKEHCTLRCDICENQFQTFTQLKSHFRESHSTIGHIICCGRKFTKRIRLVEHVTKLFDPEAYTCEICKSSYSTSQSLKLHTTTFHESTESEIFECKLCKKSFTKQSQLNSHLLVHKEPDNVPCDGCDKIFPSQIQMKAHFRNKHVEKEKYVCEICAKSFQNKSIFERHRKEHEHCEEVKVQCTICNSWLKNRDSLRKHMQRHDDKIYSCDICGKKAPNRLALKSHKDFTHNTERLHKCSYCEKAFKRAFTLKEHLTTHTMEVLYHCQFCPKTYNSSANLITHRRKMHQREWKEMQNSKSDSTT